MVGDRGVGVGVLVVLVAFVLALGAAGCGSDDGDGGGSDAAARDGGPDGGEPVAAGNVQGQIEAAYDEFANRIYAGKWEQACASYSASFVKVFPTLYEVKGTCAETMRLQFSKVSTERRPWVDSVKVKGPTRVIGYVKTRKEGNGRPIRFVKESGEWKLDGAADQEENRTKSG